MFSLDDGHTQWNPHLNNGHSVHSINRRPCLCAKLTAHLRTEFCIRPVPNSFASFVKKKWKMGEPYVIILPVGEDGRISIQPDPSIMMEAAKKDRLEQRVPNEIKKLEEMADFVDRTILNVNTGQESNIMKTMDQSIFLHLKVPKLREKIAAINTIEERVRCAKEFFSWVPIREEILNSKTCFS